MHNGYGAAVNPMYTIENGNVAILGCRDQWRITPHCITIQCSRSLLDKIACSHILIEHHWFTRLME